MTVVLKYTSGKTEIVSFDYGELYPQRMRVRQHVGGQKYEETLFYRERWLRSRTPVYIEEAVAPKDAA